VKSAHFLAYSAAPHVVFTRKAERHKKRHQSL
jgi:hypothetical protein